MATTKNASCACGVQGTWSNRTEGSTRWQSWDVTTENGETHRTNWWWDNDQGRSRGVCTETGRTNR